MKKLIILAIGCVFIQQTFAAPDDAMLSEESIPSYAQNANPNIQPGVIPPDSDVVAINGDLKVIPHSRHEEDQFLHYSIDVTYPQIIGNLSKQAQQFNELITKIVDSEVEKFKTNVNKDLSHIQSLPEEVQHNTFKVDYDIDVIHPNNQALISVRLSIEGMQAGRAHPFHTHEVLNFDLNTGRAIALKDLFKNRTNFLKAIAEYSHTKLNETLKDQDKWMLSEGTKPNNKNYKNWNLEEDALLITFDEYQVAPYAYGPQEIEIPYSELKNLLSPKAPIISMVAKENKQLG